MSVQSNGGDQRPGFLRREARRLIPLVGAAVLFVLFMIENSRSVRVTFLFWRVNTSLIWALLLAGALGFVSGLTFAWLRGRHRG